MTVCRVSFHVVVVVGPGVDDDNQLLRNLSTIFEVNFC